MEYFKDNTQFITQKENQGNPSQDQTGEEMPLIIDENIQKTGVELCSKMKTIALFSLIVNGLYLIICFIGFFAVLIGAATHSFYHSSDTGSIIGLIIAMPIMALLTYMSYRWWRGSKTLKTSLESKKQYAILPGLNDINWTIKVWWWIVMLYLAFICIIIFITILTAILK